METIWQKESKKLNLIESILPPIYYRSVYTGIGQDAYHCEIKKINPFCRILAEFKRDGISDEEIDRLILNGEVIHTYLKLLAQKAGVEATKRAS